MAEKLKSTNFKKDYVAASAIVIFFFIVLAELFLAVWIPLHLKSGDVWAEEVARQQMIDRFDGLRNGYRRFKSKSQLAEQEAEIVLKCLNSTANYLRRHHPSLSLEHIQIINKYNYSFERILSRLRVSSKPAYGQMLKVNIDGVLSTLQQEIEREIKKNKEI